MNKTLHYGVKIQYKTKGHELQETRKKTIQYIVKVRYREDDRGELLCTLNREGFAVNGKLVYRLMDVLAERCVKILYPFVFKVGRSGMMLGVENLEQVQRRWVKALPELRREYTGEEANAYFESVTKSLSSLENFRQAIKRDMFYYLFFVQQPVQDNEEARLRLPLIPGEPATVFEGRQTVRSVGDSNRVLLRFSGKCEAGKIRHRSKVKEGHLELKYTWDLQDFDLRKAEGQCYLVTGKEKEISFKITRL
ncbi:hypothetical protein LS482_13930 [Sinomicrobium kalidii]|uniref:hypothetical protein n=1 Tax=Sinomicrobium kalidii TaxID=2900738 RepID=UPI001E37746D|nr:hypothetical protein [Sinomicrobium kalidii]UGU14791.1 hypothetical protein LS482_13930 [Sinomicrobium kalidii]